MKLDFGMILKLVGIWLFFKKKEPIHAEKRIDTSPIEKTSTVLDNIVKQNTELAIKHKPPLTTEEIEALMKDR